MLLVAGQRWQTSRANSRHRTHPCSRPASARTRPSSASGRAPIVVLPGDGMSAPAGKAGGSSRATRLCRRGAPGALPAGSCKPTIQRLQAARAPAATPASPVLPHLQAQSEGLWSVPRLGFGEVGRGQGLSPSPLALGACWRRGVHSGGAMKHLLIHFAWHVSTFLNR